MSEPRPGFVVTLRRLLANAGALAATRVELASTELELGVNVFVRRLVWLVAALILGFVGLVFLSVFVLIAFWDGHRLLAAGVLLLVYAGAATGALLQARRVGRQAPGFMAGTVEELRRDAAALRGAPR